MAGINFNYVTTGQLHVILTHTTSDSNNNNNNKERQEQILED